MVKREEFLWVETYRPRTIEDCILPAPLKSLFQNIIKQGELTNMLLFGGPGIGKTTVARALCEEMGVDYLFINASEESGIDVLRTKIRNYASSYGLDGGKKAVLLDEADFLNAQSTQQALRGAIEEFSANCRFILTANYPNRLIPALHSRCRPVDFSVNKSDRPKVAAAFMERVKFILETEKVDYETKPVSELIIKHFPDFRRILSELQAYASGGNIDSGVLVNLKQDRIQDLIRMLKDKNFAAVRKWVAENSDDPDSIYKALYDGLYSSLDKNSIPQAILLIGQYQFQSSFVADQQIQMVCLMLELMANCQFKS